MSVKEVIFIGLILSTSILIVEAMPRYWRTNATEVIQKDRVKRDIHYPSSGSDIVFPDDYDEVSNEIELRINGSPKCANGHTFCEDFNPYPSEKIQSILEKHSAYKEFWGKDETSDILGRDGPEDNFICAAFQRTIFPNIAKNKNNEWKYIVNQPSGEFRQGIRVETCKSPGKSCELFGELPNGYVTYCKQKFIYRRLISLGDDGSPNTDTFQLPSACCCAYRRNYEFLQRFGKATNPINNG